MGRTASKEPQCLYKGDLYFYLYLHVCVVGKGRSYMLESEHFSI